MGLGKKLLATVGAIGIGVGSIVGYSLATKQGPVYESIAPIAQQVGIKPSLADYKFPFLENYVLVEDNPFILLQEEHTRRNYGVQIFDINSYNSLQGNLDIKELTFPSEAAAKNYLEIEGRNAIALTQGKIAIVFSGRSKDPAIIPQLEECARETGSIFYWYGKPKN